MVVEAPARRLWTVVAALWFLLVGPGAVLYAGWVLVIDRAYFPRAEVLPFLVLYLIYAIWIFRLGREHFSMGWTRWGWIARVGGLVVFIGAFVIIYAPALLLALGVAAAVDAIGRRLAPAVRPRRAGLVVLANLLAFAALFPVANRLYLNRGVFYTFFAPEPPRLMENARFDVNSEGLRGPELPPPSPDRPTVLLAGDSVTWGFPYPWRDTFARHLADRLEERGLPVRIVNAGIPSQSIVQIEARLEDLLDYAPRAAVLMVGYQWTRSVEHQERIQAYRGGHVPKTEWVFLPPMVPEILHLGPRGTVRGLSGTFDRWNDVEENLLEFRIQLERTLRRLKRAGVAVVVASHPALELDERIRERVRVEAERSGSVFVDVAALFSEASEFAFDDAIHPDRTGQLRMAERLAEALAPLLTSEGP